MIFLLRQTYNINVSDFAYLNEFTNKSKKHMFQNLDGKVYMCGEIDRFNGVKFVVHEGYRELLLEMIFSHVKVFLSQTMN